MDNFTKHMDKFSVYPFLQVLSKMFSIYRSRTTRFHFMYFIIYQLIKINIKKFLPRIESN